MSPGRIDAALVRRHLSALDAALQALRRHSGAPRRRPAILHRLLNERLDDFIEFATRVHAHLDRAGG